MPKKTKKISKQAKGWITRRARLVAARKHDQPNPIEHPMVNAIDRNVIIGSMRKALKTVPAPMAIVSGQLQPKRQDFSGELVLAARKKGGEQEVERLLEHHISTVVSDTRDEAWQMHHRLTMNSDVRRRNRTIADFMVMATQHPAQVTLLGSTTMQAIVEALEEAGYTKHGRSSPSENAATDTKAMQRGD